MNTFNFEYEFEETERNTSGKSLVYFTIGYNNSYINALSLAVKSLKYYNDTYDIVIICDNSMLDECKIKIPGVILIAVPNTRAAAYASINKLKIFEYYPLTSKYDSVLFIDSDIIIHTNIKPYFDKITKQNTLYVYTEDTDIIAHTQLWFSFNNYTSDDLVFFKKEKIHVFNAGCFGFCPTGSMKSHFKNIITFIDNHKGSLHIYEQSFMNVYFNTINRTDRTMLTKDNYIMFPCRLPEQSFEGKLIHYCGGIGNGEDKYHKMQVYVNKYMPFLQ